MRAAAALRPTHQRHQNERPRTEALCPAPRRQSLVGEAERSGRPGHNRRASLRGKAYADQAEALRPEPAHPNQRVQDHVAAKRRDARKPRAGYHVDDAGYATEDRRNLNRALGQIAQLSEAASRTLLHLSQGEPAKHFAGLASQASALRTAAKTASVLAHAAIAYELVGALERGDLQAASDILLDGAVNFGLTINPFTALPAAALAATLGPDWPSRGLHAIFGSQETEVIDGGRYLGARTR